MDQGRSLRTNWLIASATRGASESRGPHTRTPTRCSSRRDRQRSWPRWQPRNRSRRQSMTLWRVARAPCVCCRRCVVVGPSSTFPSGRRTMRGSTLKVTIGDVIYHIDDPKPGDGLKATVSAIQEEQTEKGSVSRILHRHRFNLDKDGERQKFAEKAGTYASDLDEVRDRVLDFLAPAPPLGEEPSGETDPAVREEALALLAAPDVLDQLGKAIQALGYAGDLAQPLLIFLV